MLLRGDEPPRDEPDQKLLDASLGRRGALSPAAPHPNRCEAGEAPLAAPDEQVGGTYELKFLLEPAHAVEVLDWARRRLSADPHASGALGDGYFVNNLYLDTPQFDIYRRSEESKRKKFRLRRYNGEATIWLEEKRKRQRRVCKRRTSIAEAELHSRLFESAGADWLGAWFREQFEVRQLRPVCQTSYHRFARVGETAEGAVRLTIDSCLAACPMDDWRVPASPLNTASLLGDRRILELKFRDSLPAMFRRLIQDLRLEIASFSKYRASVDACLPAARRSAPTTPGGADA